MAIGVLFAVYPAPPNAVEVPAIERSVTFHLTSPSPVEPISV